MTEYIVERTGEGVTLLRIQQGNKNRFGKIVDAEVISPDVSQRLMNHSPDGFEYGFSGSGPAQLALAILLDALQAPDPKMAALEHYQAFKDAFIANKKGERFTITDREIIRWFSARILEGK